MFFLSKMLIADFLKLINENKDVQDKIYTCNKPVVQYDVTIRFKGGALSVWLNENNKPASLLVEFDTKALVLTICVGERTDTLHQVIFSRTIRECIAQAILRKYGYKTYFVRKKYRKKMYCQCSISNSGGFIIKEFELYPNDPLYFRFDLKNLSIENFDKNM